MIGDSPGDDNVQQPDRQSDAAFPVAQIRSSPAHGETWIHKSSRLWLITLACAVIAIVLVVSSVRTKGTRITVHFRDGQGIQVGDSARFRGIDVGQVASVSLNEQQDGVDVVIAMSPGAAGLARSGTRFWIERPTISVSEIRGLDTLLSGRFIGVAPGAQGASKAIEFDGLDEAPAGELPEGGLEIVLEAKTRGGLRRGAPILHRGLPVGYIISVALAPDASSVEARAFVSPSYRKLVRENSIFWNASGVDLSVGLGGIKLSVDTLSTIVLGGVSMATPEPAGKHASEGDHFDVEEDANEDDLLG